MSKTRVITPHIDRGGTRSLCLPDLDDGYQALQLYDIHRAFFSGLALRVISWETVYSEHRLYRYHRYQDLDQEFVVRTALRVISSMRFWMR